MQVQHADYPFRRHGYICIKTLKTIYNPMSVTKPYILVHLFSKTHEHNKLVLITWRLKNLSNNLFDPSLLLITRPVISEQSTNPI